MMHISKKSSAKSSIIKGLAFLMVLIAAVLFVTRISRYGIPSQLSTLINVDTDVSRQKIAQMTEQQQDSLRKVFAGFWVSETDNRNGSVKKSDHLELQESGIIWQIVNWFITFPSGDTLSMYLARTGYLMPYGKHSGNRGYACDVRIIRQIHIIGNDTCYGASQSDELWLLEKSSDGFKCNNRLFEGYRGELPVFFPEGMTDIVDKVNLASCAPGANLRMYAKDAIRDQLRNLAPMEFNKKTMNQWIEHYYNPLIVDDIIHSQLFYFTPESLTVSFSISTEGKVLEPRLKAGVKSMVSQLIIQNLNSWTFPGHTQAAKAPVIDYTFIFTK